MSDLESFSINKCPARCVPPSPGGGVNQKQKEGCWSLEEAAGLKTVVWLNVSGASGGATGVDGAGAADRICSTRVEIGALH